MQKDNIIYIEHIKTCAEKILFYTNNLNEQQFLQNELVQDAVIRNLEIIGEATKKLSLSFREAHKDIPWKDIAGMRDILIHDYIGVDLWAVWTTVEKYIPELIEKIDLILNKK
jgi:uncharacterized protein with HEPN domain